MLSHKTFQGFSPCIPSKSWFLAPHTGSYWKWEAVTYWRKIYLLF